MIENKVVPWRVRSNYNLPRRVLAVLSSLKGLKYFFDPEPSVKTLGYFQKRVIDMRMQ
jgi:hypothetical protein